MLNLKQIKYEYKAVRLSTNSGEQSSTTFKELNPSAQVPVLCIDEMHLSESVAIAEYLEETRPLPAIYPTSPKSRARVRTIVEMINAGIQPKQNMATVTLLAEEFADEGAKKKWAREWNIRGFRAIEGALVKWAGMYCVGDDITFADCCLVPQVYSALRFDVDMKQFPTVYQVFNNLNDIPEVQAAHADRQPDAQS